MVTGGFDDFDTSSDSEGIETARDVTGLPEGELGAAGADGEQNQ